MRDRLHSAATIDRAFVVTTMSRSETSTQPDPRPARGEVRHTLTAFNWSGSFRGVFDTVCTTGSFIFVGFALSIGIEKEQMGFIAALASFACVVQILGLPLVNLVSDKKRFVLNVALAEPLLLIAAVLMLAFLPSPSRIPVLAIAVFAAAATLHLTRPMTDNWIATTIPMNIRGRYLGRRIQAINLFVVIATLAAGYLAERMDKANTFGMGCILAIGAVFGVLSVAALRGATMPALSRSASVRWRNFREVFQERPFRRWLLGIVVYNLPFLFAMPYYQVFNLTVVHLKETWIAYMAVGYLLVKVLVVRTVGRHFERFGPRRMLLASAPAWVLFFASFAFSTPDRIWPVFIGWAFAGLAESVYGVAYNASLYAAVPETPARPVYFAIANLTNFGVTGLGALLAVPLVQSLKGTSLAIGPLALGQFQCFFGLCALLMVVSSLGARLFETNRQIIAG